MDWDIDIIARLLVAAVLGATIGWERELMNRSAGLRTHTLVSLGSALFTILSLTAFRELGKVNDPARIAAQVVSGIGFLGAGTIMQHGITVRGLTSAATLWVVAAIGMAAGSACYTGALTTTLISLLTLVSLRSLEHDINSHNHLHVELVFPKSTERLERVNQMFETLNLNTGKIDIHDDGDTTYISATVTAPVDTNKLTLIKSFQSIGIANISISS